MSENGSRGKRVERFGLWGSEARNRLVAMSDLHCKASRGKWSDDQILDTLRSRADEEADRCFAALSEELERNELRGFFAQMSSNDEPLPADDIADESLRCPAFAAARFLDK